MTTTTTPAAVERLAKIAECAFDDRPRSRFGHPSHIDWEDGYRDGTRAAAAAIRAAALTPPAAPEIPAGKRGWKCNNCQTVFTSTQQARKENDTNGGPCCPYCKAHGQYTYPYNLHIGDPCEVCGVAHDDVDSGPCPGCAYTPTARPAATAGEVERASDTLSALRALSTDPESAGTILKLHFKRKHTHVDREAIVAALNAAAGRGAALASDRGEIERLREAAQRLLSLERGITIDIGSCHSLRGPGANSEMREDDRELRRDVEAAFDALRAALSERPVPYQAETERSRAHEKLGRFGHHPDAQTDYECEIDALIGMAYERLTMGGNPDLEDRIGKAMEFRALSTPGELRWLNQTFRGVREIYAVKPAWVQWPEDKLAHLAANPTADGAAEVVAPDAGEVKRLPRLTDAMIRAACKAHFGTDAIDVVDLTVNEMNWTFRDAFKRMWSGARAALGENRP